MSRFLPELHRCGVTGRSILLSTGMIFQIDIDRRIGVGDRLSLHALKRIDQQQRPFTGREAARDFVVKVDVARRVDQVQFVDLAVVLVVDRDGAGFDRDAPFAFDVQIIEDLFAELALRDRLRFSAATGRRACSCRGRYGRRSKNCE